MYGHYHFIRMGIAHALGIDELLQLATGHLKFTPLKPSLTLHAVVCKKYRLLSKSRSGYFLRDLPRERRLRQMQRFSSADDTFFSDSCQKITKHSQFHLAPPA